MSFGGFQVWKQQLTLANVGGLSPPRGLGALPPLCLCRILQTGLRFWLIVAIDDMIIVLDDRHKRDLAFFQGQDAESSYRHTFAFVTSFLASLSILTPLFRIPVNC